MTFKIIPVLDLLDSLAVHAVEGKREQYEPLSPIFFPNCQPVKIVQYLLDKIHCKMIYVADLNSITKKGSNLQIITRLLSETEAEILLDPGITTIDQVYSFYNAGISSLILGLETITDFSLISAAVELYGKDNIFLSIDMYNQKLLSPMREIEGVGLLKFGKVLTSFKVKNIILLDLAYVGTKKGGIPPDYPQFKSNFTGNVFVGGGIKNYSDIQLYKQEGFAGVLIATSLYDGTIPLSLLKK